MESNKNINEDGNIIPERDSTVSREEAPEIHIKDDEYDYIVDPKHRKFC